MPSCIPCKETLQGCKKLSGRAPPTAVGWEVGPCHCSPSASHLSWHLTQSALISASHCHSEWQYMSLKSYQQTICVALLEICWTCRQRHCTSASLDPDNASILVCGGGGVALEVTRKLKDMGSWVWMLQRSDSRRYENIADT